MQATTSPADVRGLLLLSFIVFIALEIPGYVGEAINFDLWQLTNSAPPFWLLWLSLVAAIAAYNIIGESNAASSSYNEYDIAMFLSIALLIILELYHAAISRDQPDLEFVAALLLVSLFVLALRTFPAPLTSTVTLSQIVALASILVSAIVLTTMIREAGGVLALTQRPEISNLNRAAQCAAFGAVVSAHALLFLPRGRFTVIYGACLILGSLVIVAGRSRGAWVGLLFCLAILGIWRLARTHGWRGVLAASALITIGVAAVTLLSPLSVDAFLSLGRGLTPESEAQIRDLDNAEFTVTAVRLDLMETAVSMFAQNPLIGRGAQGAMSSAFTMHEIHGVVFIGLAAYGIVGIIPLIGLLVPELPKTSTHTVRVIAVLAVVAVPLLLAKNAPLWFCLIPFLLRNDDRDVP